MSAANVTRKNETLLPKKRILQRDFSAFDIVHLF